MSFHAFPWFFLVRVFQCLEDISPFCKATDTPVFDFWSCLPWVSKSGWIPFACFFARVILRFTSGVTPADLLVASMIDKPFWSMYLQIIYPHALVGVQTYDWPNVPQHNALNHSATPVRLFLLVSLVINCSVKNRTEVLNLYWKLIESFFKF